MNAFRTTSIGALVALVALAGCERREDAAVTTPGPGSTASAPGMAGDTGSMAPGGAATTTPPAAGASGVDTATPPNQAAPAGASAPASGSTSMAPTDGGTLSKAEETFVIQAAAGGLYEVQVSQLAADKATTDAVRNFANMLVKDHSAANAELKALAASRQVQLPDAVPKDKQAVIDKLKKASGADFDRQYAQTVGIKDHDHDIQLFEAASKEAQDPQLKAWIDKTLPTLREHLAAAQKLPGADKAPAAS